MPISHAGWDFLVFSLKMRFLHILIQDETFPISHAGWDFSVFLCYMRLFVRRLKKKKKHFTKTASLRARGQKVVSLKKLLFHFSQKDIHTAFSFLFSSVLLSCYHHLKAKLGMYFAPSIFEDFRMVWMWLNIRRALGNKKINPVLVVFETIPIKNQILCNIAVFCLRIITQD